MKFKALFVVLILVLLTGVMGFGGTVSAAETEQQSQFVTPIMVANTSFLNIRTGPGNQYNILLTVVGGTELPVLGVYRDGVWYQVSTVAGAGWINSEYAIARGDFSNVPLVEAPPLDANATTSTTDPNNRIAWFVANTGFLNIRSGPGIQYTIVTTVVGGTELTALGVFRDRVWYLVQTDVGQGWLNSEYAIARGNFSSVPVVEPGDVIVGTQGASGVNFGGSNQWGVSVVVTHWSRYRPTIIETSSPGQVFADESRIFPLIEAASGDGIVWYRVNTPEYGLTWVEGPKSALRPFGCDLSVGRVNGDVVPRLGPDGSGTLDGTLTLLTGSEVYIVGQASSQFKVALIDGNTGWVPVGSLTVRADDAISSELCSGTAITTTSGGTQTQTGGTTTTAPALASTARVVVNTGFLNIRSGPGAIYSVITTVPGGTELAVVGFAPDGVWYLVEGTFGQGWINGEFTLFRGDGSNVPVVTDFVGATVTRPVATITNAVTLYSAPDTALGILGAISGPVEAAIVARTSASDWVQISTDFGFGWIRANEVAISGDLSLVPIVGG